MPVAALIVAAGRGTRATIEGGPLKQYAQLAGKTVLARSIEAMARHPSVDLVIVAIGQDDAQAYRQALTQLRPETARKLAPPVTGGSSRQQTVRLGLEALRVHAPMTVLIHDAARPFVSPDTVGRVIDALTNSPGAIAAVPLADTLKRADPDHRIAGTIERTGLWRAQTPQGFRFADIDTAHTRAHVAGLDHLTDDAAVAEWAGIPVVVVAGSDRNVKLTTAEDLQMAELLLAREAASVTESRVGTGFDVHRFAAGASVWLCGVEIPHTSSLEGHSDADVGLHALTDALLGAIGAGDIGHHFPPSDMRWKDAASHIFLSHAATLVAERGGRISNVDVTILAEAPRVSPHRDRMCARIAEILGISPDRVSVKATTTEGLGFTGRREGIAAMASASVALPVRPSTGTS